MLQVGLAHKNIGVERGKETAEIGKVLKALRILGLEIVIQPRGGGSCPTKSTGEKP